MRQQMTHGDAVQMRAFELRQITMRWCVDVHEAAVREQHDRVGRRHHFRDGGEVEESRGFHATRVRDALHAVVVEAGVAECAFMDDAVGLHYDQDCAGDGFAGCGVRQNAVGCGERSRGDGDGALCSERSGALGGDGCGRRQGECDRREEAAVAGSRGRVHGCQDQGWWRCAQWMLALALALALAFGCGCGCWVRVRSGRGPGDEVVNRPFRAVNRRGWRIRRAMRGEPSIYSHVEGNSGALAVKYAAKAP